MHVLPFNTIFFNAFIAMYFNKIQISIRSSRNIANERLDLNVGTSDIYKVKQLSSILNRR